MKIYQIDFGDAVYSVIADGPKHALDVLQAGLGEIGEEMPTRRFIAKPLNEEQARAVSWDEGSDLWTAANLDWTARLVGCSEWTS
jgi:hypothetical protein